MVAGLEFKLVLSKRKLGPGRVMIQFVNAGEDPHDLRIQRLGSRRVRRRRGRPGDYENIEPGSSAST